jgi:hypothetical protein
MCQLRGIQQGPISSNHHSDLMCEVSASAELFNIVQCCYVELQKVRRKLALGPSGSKEMLLSSFYGGCIPPLRHMHACAIQLLICDDEVDKKALLHQVTPNAFLLPSDKSAAGVLILTESSGCEIRTIQCSTPGLWGGRKQSCQLWA